MKKTLFLNTNRNCYEPNQYGRTITVEDLISLLSEFDSDKEVFLRNDDGCTYDSVVESDFVIEDYNDDMNRLSALQDEYNKILVSLGYVYNENTIRTINKQLDEIYKKMNKLLNS